MTRKKFRIKIHRLILYILVLALLCFLFWFNHRRVLLIFIAAQLMTLIPTIFLIKGSIQTPEFSIRMLKDEQPIGEKNGCVTRLSSGSIYPFSRIEMKYVVYHSFEEQNKHSFRDYFSFLKGVKEYTYSFSFDYCGIYHIIAEEIRVYDMLGIVYIFLPPVEAHAAVMPKEHPVSVSDEKLALKPQEEDFNDPTKGFDVSEIKELRDYRDGDKLSQVHWKLSTKSQDLIVKEYERQAGTCIVISCTGDFKTLPEINDYFELLNSFGRALIKEQYYFELVYLDREEQALVRRSIDNTYDFDLAIHNMYYNMLPASADELLEYYSENFGHSKLFLLSRNEPADGHYRVVESYKTFALYSEIG